MSLRKLPSLASLFLLAAAAAAGAGFTLEQVMSSPFPHDLVAAEKANRIAWVFNQKGVRNVWVADGPDFKNARAITHYAADDGQEIASLRLTPDGRTAAFVRGSELNDAGEVANPTSATTPPKQQVWALDVESKSEPRLLGEMGCAFEGCEDIEVSPDGTRAVWATARRD